MRAVNYYSCYRNFAKTITNTFLVGQGLPILSSGGGFNCRGDMRPVSKATYEKHLEKHKDRYKKIFELLKPKNDIPVNANKEIEALKERVKDADSIKDRREIMSDYYNMILSDGEIKIYNESLQKEIFVNKKISKKETVAHAAKRENSTLSVFELLDVLKNANKVSELPIKTNSNNQKNNFVKMLQMSYNVEGVGEVKLMIGVKESGKLVQYCLTATT